jgi:chromosome segregation ATPase
MVRLTEGTVMSSSESELITAFREEMRAGFAGFTGELREGFAGFRTEMRDGLSQVSVRLDRTNELLIETRGELHEMKGELHEMKGELREVKGELHEMNGELREVKGELREVKGEVNEMKTEMSLNFRGISNFLLLSEKSHNKTDKRLDDLENRIQMLEDKKKKP